MYEIEIFETANQHYTIKLHTITKQGLSNKFNIPKIRNPKNKQLIHAYSWKVNLFLVN